VACSIVVEVPGLSEGSRAQIGNFLSVGDLALEIFPVGVSAVKQALTDGKNIFELKERTVPEADYVQKWRYVQLITNHCWREK
jgi:hypothetical protein